MTKNIRGWKTEAKNALRGNYGIAILGLLAVTAVNMVGTTLASSLFSGSGLATAVTGQAFVFILSVILSVFTAGLSLLYLNIARNGRGSMADLVFLFRNKPDRVIIAGFVFALIEMVVSVPSMVYSYVTPFGSTFESQMAWMTGSLKWMFFALAADMLLTIPLSMTYNLLADDLDLGGMDALKQSWRMMKGHAGQYLLLILSFLPLLLLSVFTLYLALLWIGPYMNMAEIMFYRDLRGEFDTGEFY